MNATNTGFEFGVRGIRGIRAIALALLLLALVAAGAGYLIHAGTTPTTVRAVHSAPAVAPSRSAPFPVGEGHYPGLDGPAPNPVGEGHYPG